MSVLQVGEKKYARVCLCELERERERDGKWRECFATSLKVCVPAAYMPLRSLSLERFAIDLCATHCLKIYTPSLTDIRSHTLTHPHYQMHEETPYLLLSVPLALSLFPDWMHTHTHTSPYARMHAQTHAKEHSSSTAR